MNTQETSNRYDDSDSSSQMVLTSPTLDNAHPHSLPTSSSSQTKSKPLIQNLLHIWDNLNFRLKLTLLLLASIALPVIAVTEGIVNVAEKQLQESLEQNLKLDLRALEDELGDTQEEIEEETAKLAKAITLSQIDVSDVNNIATVNRILSNYTKIDNDENFYLITDAQGKTVAQKIQIKDEDFSKYSLLPAKNTTKEEEEKEEEMKVLSLPTGINLGDIPIVKSALEQKHSLSGLDLWQDVFLKRLGLLEQAAIGLRSQQLDGLAPAKRPFPENTYDISQGQAGLVIMAVDPITVNGKVVGTAIIGTLLNRNYEIVDEIKAETEVSTATLFAKDWRVSTNVPYTDGQTRAIGTRVSREVADAVLSRGEDFFGTANIIGKEYITRYSPIYNYQRQLDSGEAKIIGIAYVGEPQRKIGKAVRNLALVGYSIGGGILIVASLVAIPIATSVSSSLSNLANFARQIGAGDLKKASRLKGTEREDEIGTLSREMNKMLTRIDASVEQERQQKEILQEELLKLLDTIEDAAGGDLTVRAEMNASEVAIVADFFNAIIENLRELISEVKLAVNQVNISVGENEGEIRQLVEKTLEQATQINQTLTAVEQMTFSIQDVAHNAKSAAEVARGAATMAETGEEAIDHTVETIIQLRSTVIETGDKVRQLGESSQQIFKAISLINQIALKTNLLAVNASIEAARAGEEGRGFAVVAEEIGKLANQSATATKEIEQILENIQLETNDVLEVMEVSIAQVAEGTNQVSEAKHSLKQIFEVSAQIDQLIETISRATVSQAETSQYVRNLMEKIASISDNTADSSRHIASSLEQTADIVERLQTSVETFKVEEDS